jgi:hypothetical protein
MLLAIFCVVSVCVLVVTCGKQQQCRNSAFKNDALLAISIENNYDATYLRTALSFDTDCGETESSDGEQRERIQYLLALHQYSLRNVWPLLPWLVLEVQPMMQSEANAVMNVIDKALKASAKRPVCQDIAASTPAARSAALEILTQEKWPVQTNVSASCVRVDFQVDYITPSLLFAFVRDEDVLGTAVMEDRTSATLLLAALLVFVSLVTLLATRSALSLPAVLIGLLAQLALIKLLDSFVGIALQDWLTCNALLSSWVPLLLVLGLPTSAGLIVVTIAARLSLIGDQLREREFALVIGTGLGAGVAFFYFAGLALSGEQLGTINVLSAVVSLVAIVFSFRRIAVSFSDWLAQREHHEHSIVAAVLLLLTSSAHLVSVGSTVVPLEVTLAGACLLLFLYLAFVARERVLLVSEPASSSAVAQQPDALRPLTFEDLVVRVSAQLPLVGQACQITQEIAAVFAATSFKFVLLRGERGVGKSRIVADAIAASRDRDRNIIVFRGEPSISEHDEVSPYATIKKALGGVIGAGRFDTTTSAVLSGIVDGAVDTSFGGLFGTTTSDTACSPIDPAVLTYTIVNALSKVAEKYRVLLIFDDAEHADRESKTVISNVVRACACTATPVVVVVVERPLAAKALGMDCLGALEAVGGARNAHAAAFDLQPLKTDDVSTLVAALGFDKSIAPFLFERSCGNALWLASTLRTILRSKADWTLESNGWCTKDGKRLDSFELSK